MEKDISDLIEQYRKFYPQYTLESLIWAVKILDEKHGSVEAITLDYYMKDIASGGLGYGVKAYREKYEPYS